MASGTGPEVPQRPQWGMSEGGGIKVSMHRHPDIANRTRPEHGALARCKYGLLAPEEPAGDPAAAKQQDCGDSPEATMGTWGPDERAMGTGDQNGHHTLFACG